MDSLKKYNAWLADKNCEPIPGTDKILTGRSKRAVIKHLAYEEGVEHKHNDMIVRLPNGNCWCVSEI
jgi:hypothetical protein